MKSMNYKLTLKTREADGAVKKETFPAATEREADERQYNELFGIQRRGAKLLAAFVCRERNR